MQIRATCTPNVTLHVSVWVEIADRGKITPEQYGHAPRERVSWNLLSCFRPLLFNSHAPRERVSWNDFIGVLQIFFCVTLHVSVWVEMDKVDILRTTLQVTLHVSVWVEITYTRLTVKQRRSRSTWACELKWKLLLTFNHLVLVTLHVSVWVEILIHLLKCSREPCHAPRERVSWNAWNRQHHNHSVVTLHVSVWVEIFLSDDGLLVCAVTLHVSVWVEIFQRKRMGKGRQGHAPRERVSWNSGLMGAVSPLHVTLHVSVWVEMQG